MLHADGWVREDEAHVQVHINTYIYRLYDALRMCTCGMVSRQNYVMSTSTASIECSCNYISKVLFTPPSWYLFTISIGHIIICRWAVPPMFALKSKRMWLAQWILVCVSIRTEGLSPSMASITNMLYRLPYWWNMCTTLNPMQCSSQDDISHVHSEWLKMYYLVRPPPLNDMLKFSGCPNTVSCR